MVFRKKKARENEISGKCAVIKIILASFTGKTQRNSIIKEEKWMAIKNCVENYKAHVCM